MTKETFRVWNVFLNQTSLELVYSVLLGDYHVYTYPMELHNWLYWCICIIAASSVAWMSRNHWTRAARWRCSIPSMRRSSSSVKPLKSVGGTGGGIPAKIHILMKRDGHEYQNNHFEIRILK